MSDLRENIDIEKRCDEIRERARQEADLILNAGADTIERLRNEATLRENVSKDFARAWKDAVWIEAAEISPAYSSNDSHAHLMFTPASPYANGRVELHGPKLKPDARYRMVVLVVEIK